MTMAQRQFETIQNDPNIARFVVEGTTTGRQLGIGSYGSVEEVEVNGLICAGKKIHEALLDAGNVGVQEIASKYVQECQLMSDLRHPNITLFLGVCFLPNCQLPVLLMERLDGSLDDLLETVPNIPLTLKRSMLEDVARGLLHLHKHTPQIVHRDLTAKNVLLTTSLVAKITDFGNSRIVNLQPGQLARTFSRLPETLVYMPPEALSASSRYGPSLDIFSFGHLALFTLTQVFPGDLLEPTYANPNNSDQLVARTEIERRGEYFEQLEGSMLGEQHPCVQLAKDCLYNTPSRRPTAEQLVATLEGMRADIEGPYGVIARADAVRQVVMTKTLRENEENLKANEMTAKNEEIHRLQSQLDLKQLEIQQKDAELHQRAIEFDRVHEQLRQLQEAFQAATSDSERRAHPQENERLQYLSKLELSEFKPRLSTTWERGQDMPFTSDYYPTIAVLKGKVYVGGGGRAMMGHYVAVYDIEKDSWTIMPPYDFYWFSLAILNDQLVLVGGVGQAGQRTNTLGVWEDRTKNPKWTYPLPPMPTARSGAMVLTQRNRWLIVAGGYNEVEESPSVVEIFDVTTSEWYRGSPLPVEAYKMSSAVIKNTWYLLGGYSVGFYDQVFSVDLNDLIIYAISQPNLSSLPTQWQSIPEIPASMSAALAINDRLFALGGSQDSSAINLYQPSGKEVWVRVGGLPSTRKECVCTVLPNEKVFVVGGDSQVDIGTFNLTYDI